MGIPALKPVLGEVAPQSIAATAGLASGDEIVAVGTRATGTREAVVLAILDQLMEGGAIALEVRSPDGTTRAAQVAIDARAIEMLGYPALWIPEGGGSRDVLSHLAWLLANTQHLTLASVIANITAREPEVLQAGATLLADAYGDRLVVGIGVGHEYTTERRGAEWKGPLGRMRTYLDAMDEAAPTWPAPGTPARRLLAALGDGMLRLSAERALGAHSYFVPVEHTALAR